MLLEVEVPVVTNAQCQTTMTGITDDMICAGGLAGEDACGVNDINKYTSFFFTNNHRETLEVH